MVHHHKGNRRIPSETASGAGGGVSSNRRSSNKKSGHKGTKTAYGVVGEQQPSKGKSSTIKKPSKSATQMSPEVKEWMKSVEQKGMSGLTQEFADIRAYIPPGVTTEHFIKHPEKNRYRDVLCLDSTRVILKSGEHDYLHASYVSGSKGDKQYICTQGPLESTATDFWRMVVQEQAPIVVMLCSVIENERLKCFQYWPEKQGQTQKYGPFEVKNLHVNSIELGNNKTNALLCNLAVTMDGGKAWKLVHWQWPDWPDRSVPGAVRAILHLRKKILEKRPIVIHCSAGIGRTGTLAVLDICLGELETRARVREVYEVVREVRAQRMHSVQNELQYILIHRALVEYVIGRWQPLVSPELQKFIDDYTLLTAQPK